MQRIPHQWAKNDMCDLLKSYLVTGCSFDWLILSYIADSNDEALTRAVSFFNSQELTSSISAAVAQKNSHIRVSFTCAKPAMEECAENHILEIASKKSWAAKDIGNEDRRMYGNERKLDYIIQPPMSVSHTTIGESSSASH